ncbi:hypothetical protein [Pectobacterium aquaticum]|uniref:hypothetical protein n=1 Tax=Pectobacterium aquaticum TaxID=2204145 RepID=UPI003B9686C4
MGIPQKLSLPAMGRWNYVLRVIPLCQPSPSQIVPQLADKGRYMASESTFYLVLRRHVEAHRRDDNGQRRKSPRQRVGRPAGRMRCGHGTLPRFRQP